MTDNIREFRTRRQLLQTLGTAGAVTGIAGCLGGDDDETQADDGDSGTPTDTDDERGERQVDADLISAFGDISFDEGEMFIDLDDEVALDVVVLTDPLGQQVSEISPGSAERTIAFDLYDISVEILEKEFYTPGQYQLSGYIDVERLEPEDEENDADQEDTDEDAPDIDPEETIVTDGVALVASESLDLEPALRIEGIEPADEPGNVMVTVTNEGTGPIPVQYRGASPDNSPAIDDPGQWEVTDKELVSGESVSVPITVGQTARVNIDDEDEREEIRSSYCQGETVTQFVDVFVTRERIHRAERTLAQNGDVVFEDIAGHSDERVYCSEIDEE